MAGTGTQVLSGSSNYSGGTTIQSGVLSVSQDYNLGTPTGPLMLTGGTFQASSGFTLSSSRAVTLGSATIEVDSGTLIYRGAMANPAGGSGSLTKIGAGVLQLDGNNTFTGPTIIQNGTLAGAGTLTGPVTVNGLAHLAPGDNTGSTNFGGVGTLTLSSLTLSSGAMADFDLGSSSDLLAVSSTLTLNGATVNVANSGGLHSGTYEIMSYGALTDFNSTSLLIGSMPTGFTALVVNNPGGNQIDLNILATKIWTGSHGSAWDASTANWTTISGTATYSDGDPVVFDDTASSGSVSLAGTATPLIMTVNNSASLPYTFSGGGSISGSVTLTKQGSGTLAMNMANNTYSGGTRLNGGVLQVGASSTVSGETLDRRAFGNRTAELHQRHLAGRRRRLHPGQRREHQRQRNFRQRRHGRPDPWPAGAHDAQLGDHHRRATIYVTAPTTIADQVTGALIKDGPGTLTLTAATNNLTGTTLVNGGSLVGTVANLVTPVTLANGGNVTFYAATDATLTTPINGAGSLGKSGPGVLTLGALQPYSGVTTIGGGTLKLGAPTYQPALMHLTMDGAIGPLNNGDPIPDSSGSGNAMTMQGGGANLVAGKYNQALQLNGAEYPYAANTPALSSLNSWTDSVWINVSAATLNNYTCLMSGRMNNPSALGFDTYFKSDSVAIEIPDYGQSGWIANQLTNAVSIAPDTWTMITQTVTTNQYQLYINGVLAGTQSFMGTPQLMFPQAKGFALGGAGTGNYFNGLMDDFNLYSEALTAGQVQQLYNVGNPQIVVGGSLPTNTPVQIAHGATFDLNGLPQNIDSLADSGGSGGTVTTSVAGSITLTLAPAGTTTFSGVIQDGAGQISVTTNGPGIQVFSGSNTYTGATTINGCVLAIAGSGVYSGGFALNGGTLEVVGPGAIDGSGPLSGSGIVLLAPGGSMIARNFGNNVVVAGGTLSAARRHGYRRRLALLRRRGFALRRPDDHRGQRRVAHRPGCRRHLHHDRRLTRPGRQRRRQRQLVGRRDQRGRS